VEPKEPTARIRPQLYLLRIPVLGHFTFEVLGCNLLNFENPQFLKLYADFFLEPLCSCKQEVFSESFFATFISILTIHANTAFRQ